MTAFYTNVERYGSNILWRGYENGKAFSRRVKFQPTLYLPTKQDTPFYSLIGNKPIAPKKLDSMADAKEFIEKYDGVSGFEIYGNTNYVTQFIQEKYPNQIKFDMSLINIMSFDIEVDISDGYANIETADKAITSIALKSSKKELELSKAGTPPLEYPKIDSIAFPAVSCPAPPAIPPIAVRKILNICVAISCAAMFASDAITLFAKF